MAERVYIVTLEHDSTHNVIMQKYCTSRVDAEVYARDFQRFEKYGNTVYISVEKL